ncbi:MAG: hypothetical protein J5542_04985 [Bacteroidales bacterium]|nr:hypothetical protein [Bacteroidales bacterium]
MWNFSENDKKCIHELVNSKTCATYLTSQIIDFKWYIDFEKSEFRVPFDSYPKDNPITIVRPIMDTIQLLEYLDANGYICLLDFPQHNRIHEYFGYNAPRDVSIPIPNALMPKIIRAYNSSIYVNRKLEDLVANNYMDFEDLQLYEAKKQTQKATKSVRWAIAAVIIAGLTLIANLIFN